MAFITGMNRFLHHRFNTVSHRMTTSILFFGIPAWQRIITEYHHQTTTTVNTINTAVTIINIEYRNFRIPQCSEQNAP